MRWLAVLWWLYAVELGVELAGSLVFLLVFGVWSDWRASTMGRHLFAYVTSVAGLLAAAFAGLLWPQQWRQWIGAVTVLIGHPIFAGLILHRLVLLAKALRRPAVAPVDVGELLRDLDLPVGTRQEIVRRLQAALNARG